jgi:hypothetical protein
MAIEDGISPATAEMAQAGTPCSDGGRHGFSSALKSGDNTALPDLSKGVVLKPAGQSLMRVSFTWVSETDERAPSFRVVRRSDMGIQS